MYAIYCMLNLHVSATDDEVVAALQARLKPGAVLTAKQRAAILREHHEAQSLYRTVTGSI